MVTVMNSKENHAEKLDKEGKQNEQAFLQKDYELKISYLTNHMSRMWTRFHYFLVLETALTGGKFVIDGGTSSQFVSVVGVVVSVLWYIMGAEDCYLVNLYRDQVGKTAQKLAELVWPNKDERDEYRYVGQINKDDEDRVKSLWKRFFQFDWLSGWHWEPISTTHLASFIPFFIMIFWLFVLLFNPSLVNIAQK
jgi:hypothetical protein